MYTIKQASIRTGIPVPLIRAWERRYAVVTPVRSPSGYRLYDEAAIARLQAMRRLIGEGWSARQAAAEVASVGDTALTEGSSRGFGESEDLVAPASRYDLAATERAVDDLFGRGSFEAVIDDLVLPATASLGQAWADGRLDVAAEHFASGAISRRLAALLDQGGMGGVGPRVLVGLPPGSRHEIGALAFSVALRRLGVNVLYLGSDVPIGSWVEAVAESRAAAAVVGVVTESDVGPATELANRLRESSPGLVIAVGGGAAAGVDSPRMTVLPVRVVEAARSLQRQISPLR